MKKNYIYGETIESNSVVNLLSTTSTSITIITNVTTTSSTAVSFTKQTMYLSKGVIIDFSSVTTTYVRF